MSTVYVWVMVCILSIVSIVADLATGGQTIVAPFESIEDAGTLEAIGRLLLAINTLLVRSMTFTIAGMPFLLVVPVAIISSGLVIWGLVETFGPWSLVGAGILALVELVRDLVPGV